MGTKFLKEFHIFWKKLIANVPHVEDRALGFDPPVVAPRSHRQLWGNA